MNIDYDVYLACRIALAQCMLLEPGNPRHRIAYNRLHDALAGNEQREHDSTRELIAASRIPTLTRKQA